MSDALNTADTLLGATSPRLLPAPNAAIILDCSTPVFHINTSSVADPTSISFVARLIAIEGTVTFSSSGCTLSSISGNTCALLPANMSGATATVTASITYRGTAFSTTINLSKVVDGATGGTGSRGAGSWYASGTSWVDATADAATPGANITDDLVTITNGSTFAETRKWSGSAWVVLTAALNGNIIINGSLTAPQLNVSIGGGNLVGNSSYELLASGNRPSGAVEYNNAGISTSYTRPTGRRTGFGYGLKANASSTNTFGLTTTGADGAYGGVIGGWQPNKKYVISFWAKKTNGASWTTMQLYWNTAPSATTYLSNPTVSTTYQRYVITIVTGSSVEASGAYFISVLGNTATNDEIIIDDLQIEEGDVATAYAPRPDEILPNTITATEIANDAVTSSKIIAGAVVAGKIAAGVVTATEIAADTITAGNIAASAITSSELAANAVIAGKIAAGTIVAGDIAATTITGAKIAANTITAGNITAGTITATEIASVTITASKIAANTITASQIAAGTITATEIAANTITAAKIAAGTITATEIAATTITAAKMNITDLSAISANLGSVDIATGGYVKSGQTAFNTGTGFWLGSVSGVPKFSIGSGSGNRMTWDGTTLNYEGTVVLPPFSVSLSGTLTTTRGNTTALVSIGTLTSSVTGGRGTLSYSWSVTALQPDPDGLVLVSFGSPTSSSSTVLAQADTDTRVVGRAILTVIDADNRIATASTSINCQFGTAR